MLVFPLVLDRSDSVFLMGYLRFRYPNKDAYDRTSSTILLLLHSLNWVNYHVGIIKSVV